MTSYIFDFNGTLYQDTPMHKSAWREYFRRMNVPFTDENFYKYMCGPPNSAILRQFIDPDLTDAQVAAMSEDKERIYREIILNDPALQVLTPGADAVLDRMKAAGVPCAIATGADRANVDFYMDVLNIGRWFDYDHIFCAHRGIPGKPDPAIYRMTMEKLGYDPADTVVVEDALAGVRAAVGAGVKTVVAIDTTLGPAAFADIPEVVAVIHDFHNFDHFA